MDIITYPNIKKEHTEDYECDNCREYPRSFSCGSDTSGLTSVKVKEENCCFSEERNESEERELDFEEETQEIKEDLKIESYLLSEMENIDCNTARPNIPLSHEEILLANKKVFEHYSYINLSSRTFACLLCEKQYARSTTLTRHFKTHVCQYCNEFFGDKGDLIEHKFKHRKEGLVSFDKRKHDLFDSKENRKLFRKYSFIDREHNINRCILCAKNYARKTVLKRHLKTHICSLCGKFYEDKNHLLLHSNSH